VKTTYKFKNGSTAITKGDVEEILTIVMKREFFPLPDWDDDVAKCMLWMHISEDGVLSIKRKHGAITVAMDGRSVKSLSTDNMIKNLIAPLIDKLIKEVRKTVPSISDNAHYLPGITKIKIKRLDWLLPIKRVRYTLNHKLGKDGGRNYHFTGRIDLNNNKNEVL